LYTEGRGKIVFQFTKVNISAIKINSTGAVCNMNMNQSVMINRNVVSKKTQGFGEHNADKGVFLVPHCEVEDNDFIDSDSIFVKKITPTQ
jgi:hypothetical protein